MLSARNQFKGVIKSIKLGQIMAEVVVGVGDLEFIALISRASAESMKLKTGDNASAVIKATEVLIYKD